MARHQHARISQRPTLDSIRPTPLKAPLRSAVDVPQLPWLRPRPDRRNVVAREELLLRMRREFDDMPGLSLTLPQAVRLMGVSPEICMRLLSTLVVQGHLRITSLNRRLDSRDYVYRLP